jgi:S-adenosylmethionine decarboxylase proenzyme
VRKLKQIRQLLVDIYGCEANLDDVKFLRAVLNKAAAEMGSTVVRTTSHKFSPAGATVFAILAETHISIHTWPEYRYAALDIFICKEDIDPETGWKAVRNALKPTSFEVHHITRRIQ